MYLAVVLDLYSRPIVGRAINKRMTTNLIECALMDAVKISRPERSLIVHSDRGSQYTSHRFRSLLKRQGLRSSMGDMSAYRDNAVVECFFGSLEHDWIQKVHQPTRPHMKEDVTAYMRYYNADRLHSANDDISPVRFKLSELKVSGMTGLKQILTTQKPKKSFTINP